MFAFGKAGIDLEFEPVRNLIIFRKGAKEFSYSENIFDTNIYGTGIYIINVQTSN
jgi:hypothetical protein